MADAFVPSGVTAENCPKQIVNWYVAKEPSRNDRVDCGRLGSPQTRYAKLIAKTQWVRLTTIDPTFNLPTPVGHEEKRSFAVAPLTLCAKCLSDLPFL